MRVSPFHYKHKYTGSQRGIAAKTHKRILSQICHIFGTKPDLVLIFMSGEDVKYPEVCEIP